MKKKALLIAVAAIVLAVISACSVTLAWLTAEADVVTNTFTVGNITITLQEYIADGEGTTVVTESDDYKVVPGASEIKAPFVTVTAGSESCYVYVVVTNNLVLSGQPMATYEVNSTWTQVGEPIVETTCIKTLYRYNTVVSATSNVSTDPVFDEITYKGAEINKDNIKELANKTIVFDAFAHQSANTTQDVADAAAKTHFGFTN